MSLLTVTRRETRTLLIGAGLTVALLATVGIVVPAQRSYASSVTALERDRDLRLHEDLLVTGQMMMTYHVRLLRDSLSKAGARVLNARATTAAAMQLASRLREIALDDDVHGVRVTDLGSDSLVGSLRRVRVQLDTQTTFTQLTDLLEAIEGDSLPMNVFDVEIATSTAADGSSALRRGGSSPMLKLRAVVTALARIQSNPITRMK